MKLKPISYHDYLKIDTLLSCQKLRSEEAKRTAHDEHLFIIVHQCYELWFKQILQELNSAISVMSAPSIEEKDLGLLLSRLERVTQIQRVMDQQIDVLETMTPMDFLEFRDLLLPASGFQSLQFKIFENKMGLRSEQRIVYNNAHYTEHFDSAHQDILKAAEDGPSLFTCVDQWLERTPFLTATDFNFWESYKSAVEKMFQREHQMINENPLLNEESKQKNYKIMEESKGIFDGLFDEEKFKELRKQGFWRLSHKSILAALFIHLYRDMPILHLPFKLLTTLKDIDENLTHWRYRHALMVMRMIGTKVGTGGSSGAKYLKDSTEKHKIFQDFFQLTTFFIPRSELPELPLEFQKKLDFHYHQFPKKN
ncbi:MAG: tryptophan 2,3-dioxygenase [Bdellovibrionaceae bacterium]|nr:tryptophan 2,3-dioxygenase [Pseudobdellovibrionaceae bacterium]